MNYHIYPSYLTRLLNVQKLIKPSYRLLNVGCGKGDYNYYLQDKFEEVVGIDVNKYDISIAKKLTRNKKIKYFVMNATNLKFKDNYFDTVICIDVLEHVKDRDRLLEEVHRVLKKDGQLILSVPNYDFPITYDPINKILSIFNKKLPIGAYAFGHIKLPKVDELENKLRSKGFKINKTIYLSHYLTCLLQMYHVGLWQYLFKENATNTDRATKKSTIKYSYEIPKFRYKISKIIIDFDNLLFKNSKKSLGFILDLTKI